MDPELYKDGTRRRRKRKDPDQSSLFDQSPGDGDDEDPGTCPTTNEPCKHVCEMECYLQDTEPAMSSFSDEDAQEGERRKEEALEHHEENRPSDLKMVRAVMVELYWKRLRTFGYEDAAVDGDDAKDFVDRTAGMERGPWMGAVFRGGANWQVHSRTKSRDKKQHGTEIKRWRIVW